MQLSEHIFKYNLHFSNSCWSDELDHNGKISWQCSVLALHPPLFKVNTATVMNFLNCNTIPAKYKILNQKNKIQPTSQTDNKSSLIHSSSSPVMS